MSAATLAARVSARVAPTQRALWSRTLPDPLLDHWLVVEPQRVLARADIRDRLQRTPGLIARERLVPPFAHSINLPRAVLRERRGRFDSAIIVSNTSRVIRRVVALFFASVALASCRGTVPVRPAAPLDDGAFLIETQAGANAGFGADAHTSDTPGIATLAFAGGGVAGRVLDVDRASLELNADLGAGVDDTSQTLRPAVGASVGARLWLGAHTEWAWGAELDVDGAVAFARGVRDGNIDLAAAYAQPELRLLIAHKSGDWWLGARPGVIVPVQLGLDEANGALVVVNLPLSATVTTPSYRLGFEGGLSAAVAFPLPSVHAGISLAWFL